MTRSRPAWASRPRRSRRTCGGSSSASRSRPGRSSRRAPCARAGWSCRSTRHGRSADTDWVKGLLAALWRLVVRPAFVIDVHDGVVRLRRGEAPAGLVAEFSDVARDFGIADGTIYGVRARHGLTLDFSTEIPASAHQ